jgi:hypothetical protein
MANKNVTKKKINIGIQGRKAAFNLVFVKFSEAK